MDALEEAKKLETQEPLILFLVLQLHMELSKEEWLKVIEETVPQNNRKQ